MDLHLAGKTGLVTGASSGIGRRIAFELACEGVRVAIVARRGELLGTLAEEIVAGGGPKPFIIVQDLRADDAASSVASAAVKELGVVEILVNNAGQSSHLGLDSTDDDWDELMTLNFECHRKLTSRLIQPMCDNNWGRVIAIGSGGNPAKAALQRYVRSLAKQVGKFNITSNSVAPGKIMSEQIERNYTPEFRKMESESEIAVGEYGVPEDIAHAVCFLASPLARYITGTVLHIDGGYKL